MMNYEMKKVFRSAKDLFLTLIGNEVIQKIVYFTFPFFISWSLSTTENPNPHNFPYLISMQSCILFILYYFIMIIFSWVNHKKSKQDENCELSRDVMDELVNTLSSLSKYMITLEKEDSKELFEPLSQMICNSLYTIFTKNYVERKFRVTVVKQFMDGTHLKYSMPGYKSLELSSGDTRAYLVSKCDRYFKTILQSSKENYIILDQTGIEKNFIFHKIRAKNDILKEYIAIPHKGDFDNICFILQIDCNTKNNFGKNPDETEIFINQYIRPFIVLLDNAYVQDTMNKLCWKGADLVGEKNTQFDGRQL